VKALKANDTQFAILSSLASSYAKTGIGPFSGDGPDDDLYAVSMLWPDVEHFLVWDDFAQTGTLDDLLALKGQRVSLGLADSGSVISNQLLLDHFGSDPNTDFDLVSMGYKQRGEAIAAGDIVGASIAGGPPIASVTSALTQSSGQVKLLEFTDDQLQLVDDAGGIWKRFVIPADTYPSQNEEVHTIAGTNVLAVRGDVDEEVVYQLTKLIYENLSVLGSIHEATKLISIDHAYEGLPLPLHPGAIRYYKEVGLMVPEVSVLAERYGTYEPTYDNVEQARNATNTGTVSVLTDADSTSVRIAHDLADTLHGDDGIRVLAIKGIGSSQNIADLLYLKGADIGIVQVDALEYARQKKLFPSLADQIRYIARLYDEELHVLTRNHVTDFSRLDGKRVNFGRHGSGSEITAAVVFDALNIAVERTYFDDATALEKLKEGEIDALVSVGGRPLPLLQELSLDEKLTLLAVPFVQFSNAYRPARLTSEDYPSLVFSEGGVETLSVGSVLATYNWNRRQDRYAVISRMVESLFGGLDRLQAPGRHEKWQEMRLLDELPGWTRFSGASKWIENNDVEPEVPVDDNLTLGLSADEPGADIEATSPEPTF
jgi:TRAP transporter TAXI family solute receptor